MSASEKVRIFVTFFESNELMSHRLLHRGNLPHEELTGSNEEIRQPDVEEEEEEEGHGRSVNYNNL